MLQEEFDRELIEHEKSLSTSTSTSSPAPLSSLQKLPSKMEDWICSNCSTVNRIPHDKFRCKTEPSICLTINPSILNWIRRQRLVHNFWVKSDVQNSFSKNIRSFRNMGSIINGDFNQTSGLVAFWGPEICPSPIPLAGETIAILDDDDLFPKIVKSHESKKIYTLASIKENIIDVNHMQNNVNVYNYSKDTALPPVVVFRNIDKTGGALLARVFEQVYSADVLSATSIKVHCGAITSGVACMDGFSKIWPRGMGLDYGRADRVKWLLELGLEQAQKIPEVRRRLPEIGEMSSLKLQQQVLYYKHKGDFHPHLDGPVTNFVVICNIGYDSSFCICDSKECHRFFHERKCPKTGKWLDKWENGKKIKRDDAWKQENCPNCTVITLRSGDMTLFNGNPKFRCCHGVLNVDNKISNNVLVSNPLPQWARKCRMTFQVRNQLPNTEWLQHQLHSIGSKFQHELTHLE